MLLKIDKILFIGSCVYLLGVIAWIGNRNRLSQVETSTVNDSEQEFIVYLQNALSIIEQQKLYRESTTNLAQQPDHNNKQQLERVYIPLYQPPQIITQTPPPISEPLPPPPPPNFSEEVAVTPPLVNTQVNCTLVGLLESEQGAIALFDWNGVIERVQIGQEIAATGWILQDIVDNQAIVSYNDQIKTVAVGKKF